MTLSTSPDPAGPAIPPEPSCRVLHRSASPVADVQGNPAGADDSASAPAGLDVSVAAEASSAPAAAGASRRPAVPGEGERAAGIKPLSGKAFRDALKAANSSKAKAQRQQRARPWSKRDPYRKALPGGRIQPAKEGGQQ